MQMITINPHPITMNNRYKNSSGISHDVSPKSVSTNNFLPKLTEDNNFINITTYNV